MGCRKRTAICHARHTVLVAIIAAFASYMAACGAQSTRTGRAASKAPGAAYSLLLTAGQSRKTQGLKDDEDDDDPPGYRRQYTGHDVDADFDNDTKALKRNTYLDSDDISVLEYGQTANRSDAHAVATLVKDYFAAATAADGRRVCALLFSLLAEAVPEDYGRNAGLWFSRGNTCPDVLSKLYRHDHAMVAAPMTIIMIRINGKRGQALLGSKVVPASALAVKREYGVWKVDGLFPQPLP